MMFPDMRGLIPTLLMFGVVIGVVLTIVGALIVRFVVAHVAINWFW